MAPDRYTIASIFRRLGQTGDPWAAIDDDPVDAGRLLE
jgi:DNA primase